MVSDIETVKLDALEMYRAVYLMDVQRGCSPAECTLNAEKAMDSYMQAAFTEYQFEENE